MRILLGYGCARRVGVVVLPSLLVILYLSLSDYMSATSLLDVERKDYQLRDDVTAFNSVKFEFSTQDLDKRVKFSTGKLNLFCDRET